MDVLEHSENLADSVHVFDTVCLSDIIQGLRTIQPGLHTIHATARRLEVATDLPDFIDALSSLPGKLISLELKILETHPDEQPSWFNFQKLCHLSDLEELVITSPCPLPITDDDLATMLASWQQLRRLVLNPYPLEALDAIAAGLTLKSLVLVAENGLLLEKAAFYLDTRRCPVQGPGVSSQRLRYLDLGKSPGHSDVPHKEMEEVVLFIRSLFPAVQNFIWL
ncbi:hypothetical protein GLOTRDRAFT_90822 [Gloeophyllum trabeum ATCC 11539]|uniref:F-box domain-containing protein n=1 Tax=Gloeophyllum trabeum (strain ATCC 11539 / FP-39264 / Madison 617) TaxID=670483 RepID=S7QIM2_GLOTA|nr:uncharacterized protein GLOTRDRAFT_90822 [Gloeophyllum trabeum ATCC 11539]EPQ59137.1 hypothetical protein GLOTRDRAFT_90822 [Gloeophyllum trabeum ATCC 11539]